MTSNDTKKWSKFQKSWAKTSIFMGLGRQSKELEPIADLPAGWVSLPLRHTMLRESKLAEIGMFYGRKSYKIHDFMDIWWPQFLDEMNIQWIWMDLFMDVGWKLEFCIRWTWNPQELVALEFLCQATKFKGSHGYPSWGRAQLFRRIFTAIILFPKFPATLSGETCVLAGRRISMNFPCQVLKNLYLATETPRGAAPDTQTVLFWWLKNTPRERWTKTRRRKTTRHAVAKKTSRGAWIGMIF